MKYEATRRLYRGAGQFIEAGESADFEKHEAAPLLASGAIREAKKEEKPDNKRAPKASNKSGKKGEKGK